MNEYVMIALALGVLGVLGLIFGIILSVADKKLHVETDPRVAQIRELLGGANCGACGFAGCDAFAEAVAAGKANPGGCPPSGASAAEEIGRIMGVDVAAGEKKVARVICQGHDGVATERYEYDGYRSCAVAATIAGGPKMCRFSCIGFGDCVNVCNFGAITIKDNVASIDEQKCVGCGVCVATCPRSAIQLLPADQKVSVLCRNSDQGRIARAACMKACIACSRCVKECKYGAIAVVDGYARIDETKCTRCGECAKVCPCGCIINYEVQ